MNCLWNLRPWLLPREAAAYLSAAIGAQVDEAEILRWALDDQIELSVRLDAPIAARRTESEASRHEAIEGLCALVIEGAVRTALENLFDVQRDLRSTWQPIYFPVALVKKDGHVYRLVSPDETSLGESSLAVSKAALNEFIRLHKPSEPSRQAGTSSQDMHPRERNTLLVIIAALLRQAKLEGLSPYKAAESIAATVEELEESRSVDTIAKKLTLSHAFLTARGKDPKA